MDCRVIIKTGEFKGILIRKLTFKAVHSVLILALQVNSINVGDICHTLEDISNVISYLGPLVRSTNANALTLVNDPK